MMEMFQRCFALVFAICVVSPACCCAYSDETVSAEFSTCCGGSEQNPSPEHECGCVKMEVVTEWKGQEAISCNSFELPAFAGYEMVFFQIVPEVAEVEHGHESWIATHSSARRRAWLQCFLI